jgi:hypothetical protein
MGVKQSEQNKIITEILAFSWNEALAWFWGEQNTKEI